MDLTLVVSFLPGAFEMDHDVTVWDFPVPSSVITIGVTRSFGIGPDKEDEIGRAHV